MKTKEPFVQKLVHKAAQGIGPPRTLRLAAGQSLSAYQPHRPEKPLPQPQDKK